MKPSRPAQTARFLLLAIGATIFVIPLVWMVATALKPIDQTMSMPPRWVPTATALEIGGQTVDVGVGYVPPDATDETLVPVTAAYQWRVRPPASGPADAVPARRIENAESGMEYEVSAHWIAALNEPGGRVTRPVRLPEGGIRAGLPNAKLEVRVVYPDGSVRVRSVQRSTLSLLWNRDADAVAKSYALTSRISSDVTLTEKVYIPWNDREHAAFVRTESFEVPFGDLTERTAPQWGNFAGAIEEMGDFWGYLRNTLVLCVLTVIGTTLSSALVAYGFSRVEWPGRDKVFLIVLGTMMIPFPVIMVPLYGLFRDLGWIGSLKPLWVPTFFASAFNVFLLRQFFRTIPKELSEAARIDGCGELRIFATVILPLAKPALIVVALFQFLATWNDFLGPLIYLTDQADFTLALGLQFFQSQQGGTQWHYLMAASTLVVAPVILLFFVAQRFFIEGVTMSGMKG